jgi:hypothetical protein
MYERCLEVSGKIIQGKTWNIVLSISKLGEK